MAEVSVKNQKGFSLISLLILLPALLSALCVVSSAYLVMRGDSIAKHICRTKLLQAQEHVARPLELLLKLNPLAQALRIKREAAEKAAQTGHPAAVAALSAVVAQQVLLAAQQKKLMAQGNLASRLGPRKTALELRKHFSHAHVLTAHGYADSRRALDFRIRQKYGEFDIEISPKGSLTPHHQPRPSFADSQAMHLWWSVGAEALLPTWTETLIRSAGLRVHGHCGATLKPSLNLFTKSLTDKGKNSWHPVLSADKS